MIQRDNDLQTLNCAAIVPLNCSPGFGAAHKHAPSIALRAVCTIVVDPGLLYGSNTTEKLLEIFCHNRIVQVVHKNLVCSTSTVILPAVTSALGPVATTLATRAPWRRTTII